MVLSEDYPVWKAVRPFAFGGLAGSAATVCIQPIDMVMKRQQLSKTKGNMLTVGRQIIAEDGFLSMYRGLSAGILRQLTYGLSRLGLFQTLTNNMKARQGNSDPLPFSTTLACSAVAGGIASFIGTPPDAALVRMQADSMLPADQRRNYKHGVDALLRMAREEGVRGFFSGATPTIFRGLAMNMGMLASYGPYKRMIAPYTGTDSQGTRFLGGFMSGCTAATIALPFDFTKTRLQQQRPGPDGKLPYKGFVDCAKTVLRTEGPLAFYSGYATFLVRISPHITLTWVFMDFLNDMSCFK